MEGGGGDAETLMATDDGNKFSAVVSSGTEACMNNENLNASVFEIVSSDAQILEKVVVTSQVVIGDGSMTGHTFVENNCHDSETVDENVVSESHCFVGNGTNEVDALEKNANEANGFLESSINHACEFKENTVNSQEGAIHTPGFVEDPNNGTFEEESFVDAGSESNTFERDTSDVGCDFVESTVKESNSFENHAVDEPHAIVEDSIGKTRDFIEETTNVAHALKDSTCEETYSFVDADSVGDDVQAGMENTSNESRTFVDDICVKHHIYEQDAISGKDHISVEETLEENKISVGNEKIETHAGVNYFKSFVDARKEPQPLIDVCKSKFKALPGKERKFDPDFFMSVSGRRSYRSDVGGPFLPTQITTERLQPTKESRVSHPEPESTTGKIDSSRGRKREREESPVESPLSAQAAKRKKLFPYSLFSYLSFLSPLTLLSLLRGNRQDIVVEESLLTDESEESD